MNEAADIASILPAIVALSLWWAFLSTLDMLFGQHPPGATDQPPARLPEGDAPPVAHDPQPGGLRDLDPEFDAKGFLAGAQRAYESVLDAYAANDLETLQRLLSAEVLEVFGEACASRMARQETLEITFIGIEAADIVDAAATAGAMEITVRFRAQIVRAERAATGEIVDGDPTMVTVSRDLWTFSRPVEAGSDAWRIVATEEG